MRPSRLPSSPPAGVPLNPPSAQPSTMLDNPIGFTATNSTFTERQVIDKRYAQKNHYHYQDNAQHTQIEHHGDVTETHTVYQNVDPASARDVLHGLGAKGAGKATEAGVSVTFDPATNTPVIKIPGVGKAPLSPVPGQILSYQETAYRRSGTAFVMQKMSPDLEAWVNGVIRDANAAAAGKKNGPSEDVDPPPPHYADGNHPGSADMRFEATNLVEERQIETIKTAQKKSSGEIHVQSNITKGTRRKSTNPFYSADASRSESAPKIESICEDPRLDSPVEALYLTDSEKVYQSPVNQAPVDWNQTKNQQYQSPPVETSMKPKLNTKNPFRRQTEPAILPSSLNPWQPLTQTHGTVNQRESRNSVLEFSHSC